MPNKFEELTAKGAGAAKAVVGAIKGLTGVFNTLIEQHGEIASLLDNARASRDPEKRLQLWAKIRLELLSHEQAELEVVYPVLTDYPQTAQLAADHATGASELEEAIDHVDATDTDSHDWEPRVDALIALVKHHIDEEESHGFPEAITVIGKDAAHELDARFKARKEAIIEQLH